MTNLLELLPLDILMLSFNMCDIKTKCQLSNSCLSTQKILSSDLEWSQNVLKLWNQYESYYQEYSGYDTFLESDDLFEVVYSGGPQLSKIEMEKSLKKISNENDLDSEDFKNIYDSSYLWFGPIKFLEWYN
jgi:hypothetical protein